ncbi:MAG: M66 family metalloprotease [Polyangiaceae bacterium]
MRTPGFLLSTIATAAFLCSCNAVTGAEDLVFEGQTGSGSGSGTGTENSYTGTLSMPGIVIQDAQGVTITQVAVYQGVKATLMENGADAANTVSIVANRDTLMRVFVAIDPAKYDGKEMMARLTINGVKDPIEQLVTPNPTPSEEAIPSTINFNIPAASMLPGFSYRIELLQGTDVMLPNNPGSVYPAEDQFAPTNTADVGKSLKIVLVPFKYGADGSNRLPDTSQKMLDGYRDEFRAMYPTPDVELTLHDPVQYNKTVSANGSGWDQLLGYLGTLRSQDQAGFDVYYYGIFSPAANLNIYCGGGCVAGLGNIAGVGDAYSRAAIGLGMSDDGGATAWETAVHEIGHTHGRQHAPCGGAAGVDPQFPYQGAKLGKWGYNQLTQQLFNPDKTTDVMGYCLPIWASDYTWNALFERIKAVNGAKIVVPPELMNLTYDRARIDADGQLHWMEPVTIDIPPQNEPIDIEVETPQGPQTITGHFYGYDHLPGGVVLWPQAGGPSKGVSFTWQGQVMSL